MMSYLWEAKPAAEFSSWLLLMLALYPEDRVTALDSSRHPFMQVEQQDNEQQEGDVEIVGDSEHPPQGGVQHGVV